MKKDKCGCASCFVEVPREVEKHFTAKDGRILCEKCSVGVEPCSARIKEVLLKIEKEGK